MKVDNGGGGGLLSIALRDVRLEIYPDVCSKANLQIVHNDFSAVSIEYIDPTKHRLSQWVWGDKYIPVMGLKRE